MSFWNSLFGKNEKDVKAVQDDVNEEVGGLNFKTAIEAHIKWKLRLQGIIDGTGTEALDPNVVSQDNHCALGKWIYGQGGKEYGAFDSFKELVAAHAHFHKCAGHTLDLALEGRTDEAKAQIETGDFAKASLHT